MSVPAVATGGTAIGDKSMDGAEPGIPAGSGVAWITGEFTIEIDGEGIVEVGGTDKLFGEAMVAVAVVVCEVGPKIGLWNQWWISGPEVSVRGVDAGDSRSAFVNCERMAVVERKGIVVVLVVVGVVAAVVIGEETLLLSSRVMPEDIRISSM